MAGQNSIRQSIRRLDGIIRSYAVKHGWKAADYQVYVHINETWGNIQLLIAAKHFPGKTPEDQWVAVLEYLESELKNDRPLLDALHLPLQTFDQVAEGGLYAIGEQFVPIGEFIASASTV